MFLHVIKIKPLNGRDGRFSTGRSTANPYRDRAVEVEGKWLTKRARHPFDGCRGTVATVTGGSPRRASPRTAAPGKDINAEISAHTSAEGSLAPPAPPPLERACQSACAHPRPVLVHRVRALPPPYVRRALAPSAAEGASGSACPASAPLATSTACSTHSRHVSVVLPLTPSAPAPRTPRTHTTRPPHPSPPREPHEHRGRARVVQPILPPRSSAVTRTGVDESTCHGWARNEQGTGIRAPRTRREDGRKEGGREAETKSKRRMESGGWEGGKERAGGTASERRWWGGERILTEKVKKDDVKKNERKGEGKRTLRGEVGGSAGDRPTIRLSASKTQNKIRRCKKKIERNEAATRAASTTKDSNDERTKAQDSAATTRTVSEDDEELKARRKIESPFVGR
ncbi:hypothetical protein C8J57DRAFT_1235670 [Mycena rebaudengoi]|nr:hypothetical protein C8J57DRAFT_1235670 [Mycena rebaudengoi]